MARQTKRGAGPVAAMLLPLLLAAGPTAAQDAAGSTRPVQAVPVQGSGGPPARLQPPRTGVLPTERGYPPLQFEPGNVWSDVQSWTRRSRGSVEPAPAPPPNRPAAGSAAAGRAEPVAPPRRRPATPARTPEAPAGGTAPTSPAAAPSTSVAPGAGTAAAEAGGAATPRPRKKQAARAEAENTTRSPARTGGAKAARPGRPPGTDPTASRPEISGVTTSGQ